MPNKINPPNLEHLRSFHEICTAGSIGAAIKKTGIARATLSRHINTLEADLSSILFVRSNSGLILTALGETVFKYADNIFKVASELYEAVITSNSTLTGNIKIIASSGIASIILPSIIADIDLPKQGLEIEIISTETVTMDSREDADIAISTKMPVRKDVIASKVGKIKFGIYASHEYLEKKGIPQSISELREHTFVGSIPPDLKQEIEMAWGSAAAEHTNVLRCANYPLIWQLVLAGCGIGVTHSALGDQNPCVKRILPEMEDLTLPVWLIAQPDIKSRSRIQLVYDILAKKMRLALKVYDN